ncbi:DUF1801 domain-containing protein [Galactobacter valiniphilus]|uniref:DUF1801 domain-containing protein n=1 Tax=Galactobacter valiniphilus TaxID=2676122 RepID=A0A399J6T7_9MICC|nr:DUF1801 domain-containing protein [Galactobacter valiniphilus]RII41193.1 DUF1801 domain-containing protein [Galactobacter valiniphilus]
MAENTTQWTDVDPVAWVEAVEHPTRRTDGLALLALLREVTGQEPRMWGPSIVGFDEYAYFYPTGHSGTAPVMGFSPRKASLSLYGFTGQPEEAELLAKLGKHKIGKSCLYINKLADVDPDVLRELAVTGFKNGLEWKAKGEAGEMAY